MEHKLAMHWKILIGLLLGVVAGLAINLSFEDITEVVAKGGPGARALLFVANFNGFIGDVFLNGLRFIAVPIVLFSLIVGASSLNDLKKLSRIGGKTIVIYLCTTALSISIGLTIANLAKPGKLVDEETRTRLAEQFGTEAASKIAGAEKPDVWATLLDIVPKNPFKAVAEGDMLQIVFFALMIGIALTLIPKEKADPIIEICDGMTETIIKLVHIIMYVAPYAVFALIAEVVAKMGLDVLKALVGYSLVVVSGLATMMFVVYPTIMAIGTRREMSFRRFFRGIAPAQLLAFSSSSSSATLPVTMECAEERLGVSEEVSSFVLPLGATINMDGTALYQGVAAVFIAQVYNMDLSIADQLTIVLTATLASIGTAGVPGVGMIMLVIVLQSVGIPLEGIAVILGVDRLLDMCRTTCNVTGDTMVAAVIAATEGDLLSEEEVEDRLLEMEEEGLDEHPLEEDEEFEEEGEFEDEDEDDDGEDEGPSKPVDISGIGPIVDPPD